MVGGVFADVVGADVAAGWPIWSIGRVVLGPASFAATSLTAADELPVHPLSAMAASVAADASRAARR